MATERNDPTRLGAFVEEGGVTFRLWSPASRAVDLLIDDGGHAPLRMTPVANGFHETFVEGLGAGARYRYRLDGGIPLPDPASRYQPEGVHGPSEVVDPRSYCWHDDHWSGIAQAQLVFYELHIGTFTPKGTFDEARRRLPELAELGVTAIELMPMAAFPGRWNWGYDTAAPWAPCAAYGRPDDLRALIDAAHQAGIAVFLDVVYNHFGPDGAYATAHGPYLTERRRTPWGAAIALDGEHAAAVRAYFIGNALHWLHEYHVDGLRLDATFTLYDDSPVHFLAELAEQVHQGLDRRRYLIAEDDRNLDLLVQSRQQGGYGLDAQWADDFHHLLRRLVAGDEHGYYSDYPVSTEALARTIEIGWYYTGQFSRWAGKNRGTVPRGISKEQLVYCIQNHDQVGNRPVGDRLHHAIDLATYRAVSSLLLYLPQLPLLFMGQEWAASTPFIYFTDHHNELGHRVSEGRCSEFAAFPGFTGRVPDPQDPETFARSKLIWSERGQMPHAGMLRLYRDLLQLRRELRGDVKAHSPQAGALVLRRGRHTLLVALWPDLVLPAPPAARIRWHSEDPAYVSRPRLPLVNDQQVRFVASAAVLMEDT